MNITNHIQIQKMPEKKTRLFDNLIKEVKRTEPYVPPTYVSPNILKNPTLNMQVLRDMLMNIDNLNDQQLYELVLKCYDNILSDIFINGNTEVQQKYLTILVHPRFLTVLNQVMYKVQLSYDNRIYCNKIIYDYMSLNTNDDQYIKDLLLALARTVNRDIIPILIGLGLPEEVATFLTISKFSSKKELVNIKRLNHAICLSDPGVMTEEMIINIYEKLINNITLLFEGIMFDLCNFNTVSEDYADIYSLISLAVLSILNNLPSETIRSVLVAYAGDFYSIMNTNQYVRFSMQSLSMDYYRVSQIVEYLRNVEMIYVP